jgi:hypothetical protein
VNASFFALFEPNYIRSLSPGAIRRLFVKGLSKFAELDSVETPTPRRISRRYSTQINYYDSCPICQHRLLHRFFPEHRFGHVDPWDPKSVVIVAVDGAPEPGWEKD